MERKPTLSLEVMEKLGLTSADNHLLEAACDIWTIWFEFFLGSQTPEDSRQRRIVLTEYLNNLPPEVQQSLEETRVESQTIIATIRDVAQNMSREEKARQTKEPSPRRSTGEATARRRQLAQERRGTPRKLIH